MKKLLANRWQTPDGTILWSKYRHDFVGYTDKNGQFYFVDGGNHYTRTSINTSTQQMKNLCVYDDGTFKKQREWILWDKLPIKNLEINHIYRILELNYLSKFMRRLLEDEILFRCGEIVEQITIKG